MTLRRLLYAFLAILVFIWLSGFVLVLVYTWSQNEYCRDDNCFPLDSLTQRMKLANVAAVSLVYSFTPLVITVMMIPFLIWFWRTFRKK